MRELRVVAEHRHVHELVGRLVADHVEHQDCLRTHEAVHQPVRAVARNALRDLHEKGGETGAGRVERVGFHQGAPSLLGVHDVAGERHLAVLEGELGDERRAAHRVHLLEIDPDERGDGARVEGLADVEHALQPVDLRLPALVRHPALHELVLDEEHCVLGVASRARLEQLHLLTDDLQEILAQRRVVREEPRVLLSRVLHHFVSHLLFPYFICDYQTEL